MDPRLLQEASEREAVSKPAFALLALALLCVAGAVGFHLTAEDLRFDDLEAKGFASGRMWFAVAAGALSLGFVALMVHGWRTLPSGSRRTNRRNSNRSRRRRNRQRVPAQALN